MSFAIYHRGGDIVSVGFDIHKTIKAAEQTLKVKLNGMLDDRHASSIQDNPNVRDGQPILRLCSEDLVSAFKKDSQVKYHFVELDNVHVLNLVKN